MQFLKADTEIKVVIGPCVAVANGYVPVTNLSLSTADEAELMKHNAAAVTSISGNTFAAIASADGYYNLTLTAGNLDTEGMLTVIINDDSLCLPILARFMVVNANVFDSLFAAAATDYLQVDLLQMGGVAQSATDLKDLADTGYDPSTHKVQGVVLADTTTANTDLVSAADVADAVWDELITGHDGAGKAGQQLWTDLDAVLVDTGATLPTAAECADAVWDELVTGHDGAGKAGQQLWTDLDAVLVDTAVIGALGAGLTGIPWNSAWDTEAQSECADALAAYDPPTKAEMDTAHALLATVAKQDVIDGIVDNIKLQTDDQPAGIPKGVELANFTFFMVLSSDHITPATGKTIVETISKDGGAFAACTNNFAEIGNGFYKITLTATEMNAAVIALKFTETDCDQTSVTLLTSV